MSLSFPIKENLGGVEFITVFTNSNMTTIVVFLILLCIQLVYSLMISDVEEKTYEFGMLRALGFNTKSLASWVQQVIGSMRGLMQARYWVCSPTL